MRILFFLVLIILPFCKLIRAQDPQFTQFYANPLYLNPSLAGSEKSNRLLMHYRNQWPSIPGNYETYFVSSDRHFNALRGGLGISFLHDDAGNGTLRTTEISTIYAFGIPVGRNFSIRAGFQASLRNLRLDRSKLTFPDQIDARYGFIYETEQWQNFSSLEETILTRNFFDISSGLSAVGRNFTLGFAAHHLSQPDKSFLPGATSILPMNLTGHLEARIPFLRGLFSDTLSCISPAVLYQRQQAFQQLNVGATIRMRSLILGAFYRNRDALIAVLGFERKFFAMRYSYDITISPLTNATAGAHELSCSFRFWQVKK
jgi:type IX secretion system PorP/SprF family membrane protein